MEEETEANDEGNFLYLPNLPDGAEYIISMPPMNSSGDIYAMVAFIVLSLAHKKTPPKVLLTYDSKENEEYKEGKLNTYTQAQRSLHFVQSLGYESHFHNVQYIDVGNGYRQNARYKRLIEHFEAKNRPIFFLEQKALTTLVAHHFLMHGKSATTRLLNQGFSQRGKTHPKKTTTAISKYVKSEIKRLQDLCRNQPLIVLHFRNSTKANAHQNIQHSYIVAKLKTYLETKGFFVWVIFTDGRLDPTFTEIDQNVRSDPFASAANATEERIDDGKLYHLELLQGLLPLPNLQGMIGNTSGTLDLAAFIGHRVYNLHNFQNALDYQGFRILIQTTFLSLESFDEDELFNDLQTAAKKVGDFTEETTQKHFPHLPIWLKENDEAPCQRPSIRQDLDHINLKKVGYKDLFFFTKIVPRKNNVLEALPCTTNIRNYINQPKK